MIEIVQGDIMQCTCDLCGHTWQTLSKSPPLRCPNCAERKWNGARKLGRPKLENVELELPKPTTRVPV